MLPDMLMVIADQWSRYALELSREHVLRIRRQLAAAVHSTDWEPDELVLELLDDVPESDPAWSALLRRPTRKTAEEPVAVRAAAAHLRWVLETWSEPESALTNPADVEQAAEERLWTAPMTVVTDATRLVDVVVLDRGGERVVPAFQLGAEHQVLEGIAEINHMLGASEDPWGVASWWLSPHATLRAIPADVIRLGFSDDVVAAARAAGNLA